MLRSSTVVTFSNDSLNSNWKGWLSVGGPRACTPLINATRPINSSTDEAVLREHLNQLVDGHNKLLEVSLRHEPFLPQSIVDTLHRSSEVLRLEISNINYHPHFVGDWWDAGERNSGNYALLCDALRAQVRERSTVLRTQSEDAQSLS